MSINAYCDFIDTREMFNNKKIYQCSYCGLKIGLDDPKTSVLCFKKMQDYTVSINKIVNPTFKDEGVTEVKDGDMVQDIVLGRALEKNEELDKEINVNTDEKNMCSKEQIDSRMSICQSCEFYKEHSCMLCGCQIVREANYMNKLAHKDQKCPADKWGPVF